MPNYILVWNMKLGKANLHHLKIKSINDYNKNIMLLIKIKYPFFFVENKPHIING